MSVYTDHGVGGWGVGRAPEAKQIVECLRASNSLRAHLEAIIRMTTIIKHWEYSHLPLSMFGRNCERGLITRNPLTRYPGICRS